MKISLLLVILSAHYSTCFLTLKDFNNGPLLQCYDDRIENRMTNEVINGQENPLPSSMEAFITLVERLENAYPSMAATEIITKLFLAFRVDKLTPGFRKWDGLNTYEIEKAFFGVPDSPSYPWKEEDFTRDEKCALHFMLSHIVNATALGNNQEQLEEDGINTKTPREFGVVSLHGKWKHAFSLSKVLLGILAGLSGNNQVNAIETFRKIKGSRKDESLNNVKVNRLVGVTLGDLISVYVNEDFDKEGVVSFLPNGMWNDVSCTTRYTLSSNNKKLITNSDLRGAIDGLIIGKKLEEKLQIYQKVRLSQILRMYYGPTGLVEDFDITTRSDSQWCNRERNLESIVSLKEDLNNFHKLYAATLSTSPDGTVMQEINDVINFISKSSEILNEMTGEASSECSGSETTLDKRCTTPFDIFAILDFSTPDHQKNFQIEVIGNLSLNFDVRPNGNSIGVYTNLNPTQNKGLQIIVNNNGLSGCQSCFSKYVTRRGAKNSEVQVFENLNETLSEYVSYYDEKQKDVTDVKSGAPAKVILYFNYGSPNNDYKLRDVIWEVEKYFREATVLAIGPSKDALQIFTKNDDMDIFQPPSSAANAADFAAKLKSRICKIPAEFQFKECNNSGRTAEAENRKINTIGVNKKQYWAMYPKYFLKSKRIVLKFKPLDGAQIKVCYSRNYYRIVEDNTQYIECYDSSGDEINFYTNNPCHRYNEHNCDPFYFSVEGKKTPTTACENIKCSTLKDIQFEFQHEGISCNSASFLSSSTLALVFAWIVFSILKHSY